MQDVRGCSNSEESMSRVTISEDSKQYESKILRRLLQESKS